MDQFTNIIKRKRQGVSCVKLHQFTIIWFACVCPNACTEVTKSNEDWKMLGLCCVPDTHRGMCVIYNGGGPSQCISCQGGLQKNWSDQRGDPGLKLDRFDQALCHWFVATQGSPTNSCE